MPDGHHWVPEAVREKLAKWLSLAAYDVFKTSVTTNPYGLPHNYGRVNNDPELTHPRYNEQVLIAVKGEIDNLTKNGQLEGGKLSGEQATEIVNRIKKDGLGNPYILKFNNAVLKALRLAALGAIVIKGLEQTARAQKLVNQVQASGHYKKALVALQSGDWHTANKEIKGGYPAGQNLVQDIQDAGFAREAMILYGYWTERVKDFIKIENGQNVPGVPNRF